MEITQDRLELLINGEIVLEGNFRTALEVQDIQRNFAMVMGYFTIGVLNMKRLFEIQVQIAELFEREVGMIEEDKS